MKKYNSKFEKKRRADYFRDDPDDIFEFRF
jgi:hypothetical protein